MRIALHAFDGISMFHLAAPLLVFSEVSRLGLAEDWSTQIFTEAAGEVRSAEGYLIGGLAGLEILNSIDLLVLASWKPDLPEPSEELTRAIGQVHNGGKRVAGLCLGAFPVARSGILDGRTAVTHWEAVNEAAARHTEVSFGASALYIDHGDILTSAGTASSLDACLHIVRRELGATAAATVARHIVVAPHREGDQTQYIQRPVLEPATDSPLGPVIEWALANLDKKLGVEELAARAHMSSRNFTRRFKQATGTTPARWVLSRRLDEARMLLETTRWSVARIADTCGFGSAVTLRQNFISAFATTPTSYRRRFSNIS
ncbi:GlxA family transcriptional regulator [Glutamicibacter sp. BSL13]